MKEPIFILGCQRSGTTILRRVLDSHSRIACPAESSFLVQFARVFEIERSQQGLLNMGFSKDDVLKRMRVFISGFFEDYARSKGKSRWADKTPHYMNHVVTIDKIFRGELKYIGIVRHGLDVAYSLKDFDWGVLVPYMKDGTSKLLAAIRFWSHQNQKLLDFKNEAGDRLQVIKYEELTAKPREVLQGVFNFIDEAWEEEVLNFNQFEHDAGFEDPKADEFESIVVNSNKYVNWPLKLQVELYEESREMFQKLGYSL